MRNIKMLIPVAMLLLTACEKEILVKVPPHQPKLVVNSANIADDTIRLHLSRSLGALEKKGKDQAVTNAIITLYEDDRLVESISYDQVTGLYNSHTVAAPGKTYKIKASAPSYADIEATSQVPSAVAITNVQHIANVRSNAEGRSQDEIRLQFTDPAVPGDYYIIKILPPQVSDTNMKFIDCVNSIDASIENPYGEPMDMNTCLSADGLFLRDVLFNGNNKELRIFVSNTALQPTMDFDGNVAYPVVQLYHVSEAWFRFMKSYQYAMYNGDNPFSEPANVYSNITNGYGAFNIVNHDEREIK